MRILKILPLIFLTGVATAADVYKWTDANGRVQFGDRAPSGAPAETTRIRSADDSAETAADDQEVVMLSTSWCGVCRQARKYFNAKGIAFTEHDVEKSAFGRAEFKRLKGRGVPIILVGDRRMDGFTPAMFEQLLNNQ